MATTVCSQCDSSYPSMLKVCPSCKTEASSSKASPAGIKPYIPLIVAADVLLIGGFLVYFFFFR